jgi:hypothetical protein
MSKETYCRHVLDSGSFKVRYTNLATVLLLLVLLSPLSLDHKSLFNFALVNDMGNMIALVRMVIASLESSMKARRQCTCYTILYLYIQSDMLKYCQQLHGNLLVLLIAAAICAT